MRLQRECSTHLPCFAWEQRLPRRLPARPPDVHAPAGEQGGGREGGRRGQWPHALASRWEEPLAGKWVGEKEHVPCL